MYAQLLKKATGRATGAANSRVHTLPAPVGGWNARDALSAMKPEDAIILDNVIPVQGRVKLRPGYQTWVTGLQNDYVESLMEYAPGDAVGARLFAATQTALYDVTGATNTPVPVLSGLSDGRWQHVMFSTPGGQFLCAVNGVNNYLTFDGSAWVDQDAGVTGVATGSFVNIAAHARRLWFVEDGTLDAWYLPVASITGGAKKLPLGALCGRGGALLAIGTWTKDGGSGMDDLWVAVTTKGEVVVYQGTDPDVAGEWSLVGVFSVAEPVGRRCLIKVGGDIGIVTSTGLALLSQLMGSNRSGQGRLAITDKISRAFNDAYELCGQSFGWQIVEFPKQSLVIVNVPLRERIEAVQFVVNVATGGWCRFKGLNASVWSLKGDQMFFGTPDGKVHLFGEALSDNGAPIPWLIQTAYNKCGGPQTKVFRAVRPLLIASPGYIPGIEIKVDYDTSVPRVAVPGQSVPPGGSLWDVAVWDEAEWGATSEKSSRWQGVVATGRAMSLCMAGSGSETIFEFNEVDAMFEAGSWL